MKRCGSEGLDVTRDHVYPDLVFGIPAPPYDPGDAQTVGVGVMAYHGTNDDRRQADEIYASYVEKMSSSSGGWSTTVAGYGCSWGTRGPTTARCRRSWRTCGYTGPISSQRGLSRNPSLLSPN